eukprot:scpid52248/ scgid32528/ 
MPICVSIISLAVALGALSAQAAPSSPSDGMWRSCSGGIEILIATNSPKTWTEAEKECQRCGAHLAVFDASTIGSTCRSEVEEVNSKSGAHVAFTSHRRDMFNALSDYNGDAPLLKFRLMGARCAERSSGGAVSISDAACNGGSALPFICQRPTDESQRKMSILCNRAQYIYHVFAFSRQHAADTCDGLYDGGQLANTTQSDISCIRQLLNSEPLARQNMTSVEIYTSTQEVSALNVRSCGYLNAATGTVQMRPCQKVSPVVCVRQVTWRSCSGGIDLLVDARARQTWTNSEKQCQHYGGHLAVVDMAQIGADCSADVAALGDTQAHIGITASLDDTFRSLPDHNSRSPLLQFSTFGTRCAAAAVSSTNGAASVSTSTTSCNGEPWRPFICQRRTAIEERGFSILCNGNMYIYHPIAFSRQQAADACAQIYDGSELSGTAPSDVACIRQLLNSQPLAGRGLDSIDMYTSRTHTSSFAGTRCGYLKASGGSIALRSCQQTLPAICTQSMPEHRTRPSAGNVPPTATQRQQPGISDSIAAAATQPPLPPSVLAMFDRILKEVAQLVPGHSVNIAYNCKSAIKVAHSTISGTAPVFTVRCRDGYELVGNPTVTCTSPTANTGLPQCKPDASGILERILKELAKRVPGHSLITHLDNPENTTTGYPQMQPVVIEVTQATSGSASTTANVLILTVILILACHV